MGKSNGPSFAERLAEKGVTRRDFLRFCSMMAGTLALPSTFIPKIAEALEKKQKPYAIWLEFSDCTGDSMSMIRTVHPTISEIVLDLIDLEYHETLMAGSGKASEKVLEEVMKDQKGKYICFVEGAIPMKDGGIYCTIGGKTALEHARHVCSDALVTIAMGSCAVWGGIASANPNPTGAVGVGDAVPGINLVNLPGCPHNAENASALIVHYLTFGSMPFLDGQKRPNFAYGQRIHDNCERRSHFDAGQFVRQWGDEGHKLGWCLYEMGCKGPEAYFNCSTARYNRRVSWPVQAGHPCFACASTGNWDKFGPIYSRLANVPGAGYQTSADKIGLGVTAVAGAGVALHAAARLAKGRPKEEHKEEKK